MSLVYHASFNLMRILRNSPFGICEKPMPKQHVCPINAKTLPVEKKTYYILENGSLGFIDSSQAIMKSATLLMPSSVYVSRAPFSNDTMGPMIPKEMKSNLHYGEVRGDFLWPPHGINTSYSVCRRNLHSGSPGFHLHYVLCLKAGLGGSFGCAVQLETRRSRV